MKILKNETKALQMDTDIRILYIDLFCGAGGTSTGVENATLNGLKCAKVIACVNHDPHAIASHAANHPDALHFTEDIRTLDLRPLKAHLAHKAKEYPHAKIVLWASLECTNFSRAKGGQPRNADSRTLAEHLFRYIETIRPHYIYIENVEEFMCWGELDAEGRPVSRHKGSSYLRWVNNVCQYGYTFDWRILNAADYGAYTSRRRFFGLFALKGLPICFPEQTYAKRGDDGGMFQQFKCWRPVRDVLDLTDEGCSIFTKKKPLCEKTLERIYAGLVKFVAGGKEQAQAWILKYNSTRDGRHNPPGIDEPCPVVAVQNRLGLVKCHFLSKQFSGDPMSKNQGINQPAGTVTTVDHHAFVTAYYGNGFNSSIEEPAPTVTTKDRMAVVNSQFLTEYYGGANHNHPLGVPAPTVTTKNRMGIVKCQFLDNQYGNGKPASIDKPSPTVVNNPKQSLVSTHYLMNPQFSSPGGSINKPCFTLIARMDKMPPYLVSTVPEASPSGEPQLAIVIYASDTPMTRKIKRFMAAYGIIDIKMRMLRITELKRIMGFPEDYTLIGTQAEQKKFIGNAVEVNMARVLCEALCKRL